MKLRRFIPSKKHLGHAYYLTDRRILRNLRRMLLLLCCLLSLHVLAMYWLEDLSLWQSIWLTMTTVSTVGYGDLSAKTLPGQVATVLLLFVSGITMLTLIISDYVDYRMARSERIRTGFWDWNMIDHIVIINTPKYNRELFFNRLISQIREDKEYQRVPILLLNMDFPEGLPNSLRELGVVHITGNALNESDFKRANIQLAKHILVLAKDEYSAESDSVSFDIAYRLHKLHLGHLAIIEAVDDANRTRLRGLGMKSVLRPVRSYPEILVRAIDAPGSEVVIEDMFTRSDDHPERFPIWLEGERWADVVTAMVQANVGLPMAYVTKEGEVRVNPLGDEHIHAQSVIMLVKSDKMPSQNQVELAFEQYFRKQIQNVV